MCNIDIEVSLIHKSSDVTKVFYTQSLSVSLMQVVVTATLNRHRLHPTRARNPPILNQSNTTTLLSFTNPIHSRHHTSIPINHIDQQALSSRTLNWKKGHRVWQRQPLQLRWWWYHQILIILGKFEDCMVATATMCILFWFVYFSLFHPFTNCILCILLGFGSAIGAGNGSDLFIFLWQK